MALCVRRAHGHCLYGPKYRDALLSKIHRAVELCDSLQSFFVLHSMGGGTGAFATHSLSHTHSVIAG